MIIHGIIGNTTEFNVKEMSLPFYIKVEPLFKSDDIISFYDSVYNKCFAQITRGRYVYVRFDPEPNINPVHNLYEALSYLTSRFQLSSVDRVYDELKAIRLLKELSEC